MLASPKMTSPVAMPVRTTSRTPQVCSSSVVQGGQGALALGGRLDRSQRVVVVPDRQPEDRHDGVADDLLDRAAVRLEHRAHLVEVAGQDLAQRLRIEPLAERRRALEVRGDDRREPADLGRRRLRLASVPQAPHRRKRSGIVRAAGRAASSPWPESSGRGRPRSPARHAAGQRTMRAWPPSGRLDPLVSEALAGLPPVRRSRRHRRWPWSPPRCAPGASAAARSIFHAGDPGDALFIVASGSVKILVAAGRRLRAGDPDDDRPGRLLRRARAARWRAAVGHGRRARGGRDDGAPARRVRPAGRRERRAPPCAARRACRRDPPPHRPGRGPPFPGPARSPRAPPAARDRGGRPATADAAVRRGPPAVAVHPGRAGGHDRRLAPVGEPAARRLRRARACSASMATTWSSPTPRRLADGRASMTRRGPGPDRGRASPRARRARSRVARPAGRRRPPRAAGRRAGARCHRRRRRRWPLDVAGGLDRPPRRRHGPPRVPWPPPARQGGGVVGLAIDARRRASPATRSRPASPSPSPTSRPTRASTARSPSATGYVPRSLLAVPLADDAGIVGVLEVLDRRDGSLRPARPRASAARFARQATLAARASALERDAVGAAARRAASPSPPTAPAPIGLDDAAIDALVGGRDRRPGRRRRPDCGGWPTGSPGCATSTRTISTSRSTGSTRSCAHASAPRSPGRWRRLAGRVSDRSAPGLERGVRRPTRGRVSTATGRSGRLDRASVFGDVGRGRRHRRRSSTRASTATIRRSAAGSSAASGSS